jgi:hypothetical protein
MAGNAVAALHRGPHGAAWLDAHERRRRRSAELRSWYKGLCELEKSVARINNDLS